MHCRLLLITIMLVSVFGTPYAQVEVSVSSGLDDNVSLKQKIENNASKFLTEVYDAYKGNRALNLSGIVLDNASQNSIEMLWENVHFRPEDQYIVESIILTPEGYQLRNIPLEILPQDNGSDTDYKEAVINFNRSGEVSDVYFSIDQQNVKSIMEKGIQLNDMSKRMEILDYVERFRTSYNQKDLKFLNQIFSDDALIITGKVVKPRKMTDGLSVTLPSIKYSKSSKQQYLANLSRVFKNNRYINVNFDDVTIKRHGANKNIYGVRVIQHWNTSSYSDEGYLFMVWDFSNPDAPQIHVRSWQPMYLDAAKKQPLPQSEIIDLNSFEGI